MAVFDSTYWWSEYENARLKVKEIHSEILGLKVTENDKDRVEFDTDSLNRAMKYEAYCLSNYKQALAEEKNQVGNGLTYLGNGYYGF